MACQHSNGHFILPDHPRLYLKVGDFATTPLQACTGTTSFPYKHLPCNKACSSTSARGGVRRVQRRAAYAVYHSGWRTPCTTRGGVRRVQHGLAYTVYNTGRRTPCTTRGGVHRVQNRGWRTPCTTRGGVRRVQHGEAFAVYNTGGIVQRAALYNVQHCTTCSIVQRAALYNVQHCTTCSIGA